VPTQEPFGVYNEHHLWPRPARSSLPIETIYIEPEKHLAVEQAIPLGRCQPDQASLEGLYRHRPLVTDLNAIVQQFCVIVTLLLFIPVAFVLRQCSQIEEGGGTE
jgi:hypothetical protein